MIRQTPSPAVLLHRSAVGFPWTPVLYPFTPPMRLSSCARFSEERAYLAALKELDRLDAQARAELDIRPLPSVEQGAYDHEGEFEDYDGE